MGRAKEIIVKVIPAKIANEFVKQHHYSGKVVNNSTLHFGAFLDGKLHGVMSYGSPFDKSKVLHLVQPALWNEMLELNRMAFDDYLPANSESRCIAISIRLIKKNAPHIKWILSFSDGTQCGDGVIYRASGFLLTAIKSNNSIIEIEGGKKVASMTFTKGKHILKQNGRAGIPTGAKKIPGFQLRYIYLIDKSCKITVPTIPFSKIDELGAGMYKGEKITREARRENAAVAHKGERQDTNQEGAFDSTSPLNFNPSNNSTEEA